MLNTIPENENSERQNTLRSLNRIPGGVPGKKQMKKPVIVMNGSTHSMMKDSYYYGIAFPSKPGNEKENRELPDFSIQRKQFENEENYSGGLISLPEKKKRTRLVVKKGAESIPMAVERIALFCTENKIVFAINEEGKKYIVEGNLTELQQELDEKIFFRANRQYIININYIKSFRAYERVKLKIEMHNGTDELNEQSSVIISQENAPLFKKWIHAM